MTVKWYGSNACPVAVWRDSDGNVIRIQRYRRVNEHFLQVLETV